MSNKQTQAEKDELIALVDASEKAGLHKRIMYGDCEIVAPVADIEAAIERSRKRSPELNRKMTEGIKAELAKRLPRVKSGKASQKVAIECAQDIAIWFANEIVEGRAVLHSN